MIENSDRTSARYVDESGEASKWSKLLTGATHLFPNDAA
jgi:hypothetical protein